MQEDDPRSQAIISELNAPLETAYGELVRPRPMRRETLSGYEAECGPLTTTEPMVIKHEDDTKDSISSHHITRQSYSTNNDVEDNDESNNMGSLSIDESGQLRYYGKTSGFYMLKNSKNFQNRVFQFSSREHNEHGLSPSFPFVVDPFEMPPKDLSDHLLNLYFSYFYPLLPLLHKKSFMESVHDDRKPSPPPILLNAIYAVASRVSPDERVRSISSKPETAGDIFFERARMLLDLEWDSFRVYTVQSLLLMSSHQNGALKTTRGWLYSGMVCKCLILDCKQ